MNLRQRISHELENFHSGVEYHIISPEQRAMALDAYTDRILTEVREALLSGPAIQAGSIAVLDDESAACWECINEANKTTRPILRSALDAVTGEGESESAECST